ncbi:MAG: hypothetical protein J5744_08980 [Oscillospiraceae bacterium]|nr:hypothetical protein [Oscillospiraceae bacterium]
MRYDYYVNDYDTVFRVDDNNSWSMFSHKQNDWISAEGLVIDNEAWTRITEEEVEPYLDR